MSLHAGRVSVGLIAVMLAATFAIPVSARAEAASNYVWLEGEAPTSITPASVKPNISGWGHPEFLSDAKWLQISIDDTKVESEVPENGILLRYDFTAPQNGTYQIWNRIGYEFARSPFDWRVDGGDWSRISPDDLTTDLMELQTWNEVAWLKLGDRALTAGAHTLEIRLPRTKDAKGKLQRILYASDALCIDAATFYPNSKYRPGESRHDSIDTAAAAKVFDLPAPTSAGSRTEVALNGDWQVTRNDEALPPPDIATPMKDFPAETHWTGIKVPGDKNTERPDLLFAHRIWYRTRVNVPASLAGRSFFITFPQNNLNTTVFVNGVYCGFNKNPFAKFSIDVTRGMKPGVNDLMVGIRDAWYAYSNDPKDPMLLRKQFNLPIEFSHNGFQRLAYPVWGAFQSGILVTPTLTAAGPVYANDVFVRTSVARKELAADVTLANPTSRSVSGSVSCEAVDSAGKVEQSFPAKSFVVPAGGASPVTVSGGWQNPKLWWPDQPNMYRLRTLVRVDGKTVDVSETPFGFREWTEDGINFKLNGVVFHGWEGAGPSGDSPGTWLASYRKEHQRMTRFWGTSWMGMPPEQALDFFDRSGVVVRRQGMLDGEAIGYMPIEDNPDLKKLYHSDLKMDLMNNWRDQMVAQVKGERNHPSIMIWSIENEWLYINCINLWAGQMDAFEAEVTRTSDAVRAADPTRPTMSDGGGATKAQTLPVHGNHYIDGPLDEYPALAYEENPTGGGRGRWVWDEKRPRFVGEDYFMTGNHPELSIIGGEDAFQGKQGTLHASALMVRILTEGYRWAHYGAWDLYLGAEDTDGSEYVSYAPRAVFCKQWNWTFGSGQTVNRSMGIFNDTHYADPITFTWTLELGGKKIASSRKVYHVAPGTDQRFELALKLPGVASREEGRWYLALDAGGKRVFTDVKDISVLPAGPAYARVVGLASLPASRICVYDPAGEARSYLHKVGVRFTTLTSLDRIPASAKVLVVGRNALSAAESASSRLAAYAVGGRVVIVLEQKNPLKYQGLPAAMEPAENAGRTAFAEDLGHPAFSGLRQKDFFTWGAAPAGLSSIAPTDPSGDAQIVYRDAYTKPMSGGRSLLECGHLLQDTALAEVPVGKGVLLLSQLTMGEKLPVNAVAQHLFTNLLAYGVHFRLTYRPVTLTGAANPPLDHTVDAIGLKYAKVEDPVRAISPPGSRVAVINASPENLKSLAANLPKVEAFTRAGGWIVFNNLSPAGLADYNKIVGVNHLIRKFGNHPSVTNHGSLGVERVTFSAPRNPLTAGIPTGDVVLYSPVRIFNWTAGNFTSPDEFSYVVDYDDVAPFGSSPFFAYGNITNGFVSADGWPLIIDFPEPKDGKPFQVPITFPKPQAIKEFTWIGNTFYNPTTKVNLVFDGDEAHKLTFNTLPNNSPQTFEINPPRLCKTVTLEIAAWENLPGKNDTIGIDNISFKAERTPAFYQKVKPMLNVGGMMEYPKGSGGIVLCNLLFKDTEDVPENAVKKREIFADLLRNLKAPFAGGKTIIAGANLKYTPISIAKQANQYRDEKGWFGDKAFTMASLPTGRHTFAGVLYDVYDFPTSAVPTVVMLGGQNVPNNLPDQVQGIPVNQKADALFFLQAARIDRRRSDRDVKAGKKLELFDYVVTYADGQTVKIPVYSEINIDNYKQKTPTPIPGAQIAWTRPYPGTGYTGVVYSMQWNNPRPGEIIKSIGMQYGPDRVGVPALLALTAAVS
ncbi:MAG TPA: glycoside hydrolase family 2 TIM barrel-domain containing protein [Armatimonadota bacterium]|nr:glycoside hydrolase family 2 TIM barrel-domain containing protein [Armatimonadota bacterium]